MSNLRSTAASAYSIRDTSETTGRPHLEHSTICCGCSKDILYRRGFQGFARAVTNRALGRRMGGEGRAYGGPPELFGNPIRKMGSSGYRRRRDSAELARYAPALFT